MGDFFFFNGEIVASDSQLIKLNDLALLRGFGIFDFFRTHKSKPFLMPEYLNRFFRSADYLKLAIPYSREYIAKKVIELLKVNGLSEAGVRMVLTGGYTENGYNPGNPNFFILIEKINYPEKEKYEKGVKLILHEHQRELSHIKSINYLTPISIRQTVSELNAYDVLYHSKGNILEVSRSNFFIVRNGRLITPAENVLLGITRKSVLGLAFDICDVEERTISIDELWDADEVFMTGTTKKVLPVSRIDNFEFNKGLPGPITHQLMKKFQKFEDDYITD